MTDTTRVNFHCHSNLSDGYLSPEAVAEQLAAAGVRYAALTDHDTTAGLARFKQTVGRFGIGCLAGVEISAQAGGQDLHLLAYGFDPEAPGLQQLLQSIRARRRITEPSLVDSLRDSWSRIRRKETDEADEPAAPGVLPSAAEVLAVVHAAGGRAFLAHPLSVSPDLAELDAVLARLKAEGLDGLETLYSPYPAAARQALAALAEKHGLLTSAGTDFHGPTTPGLSLAGTEVPTQAWKAFRRAVTSRGRRAAEPAAAGATAAPAARSGWRAFLAHIVLPTLVAISLFAGSIFLWIVPAMRETLLDRKRDQIRELTQSAWSILAEHQREVAAGSLTLDEAQRLAARRIEHLRYGKDGKDYFWITDMRPRMVMHPYRPDLNGLDLSLYTDPRGHRVFIEFVKAARGRQDGGYVEYVWQWKDQPDRLAPKESYVKAFEPWGWIIGTGMYIEDVHDEIGRLLQRLVWIFLAIVVLLALFLAYLVRQSLKIEQQRSRNEAALRESHEKYRALVEVATEGILMVLDGRCSYLNRAMLDMLGYDEDEALLLDVDDLLPLDGGAVSPGTSDLAALREGRPVPAQFEARLRRKAGDTVRVRLAATRISFAGKEGFILIARDVARQRRLEEEASGARGSRALIEQMQLGLFRVARGRKMTLVEANAVARRLFHLAEAADPAGLDLADVFRDARDREEILHDMEARGGVPARLVALRAVHADSRIVRLSLSAAREDDGTVRYWDGVVQDVTQQQRLELQRETLIAELQTSLLFLNDPIRQCLYRPPQCRLDQPIARAAELMTRHGSSALFVTAEGGSVVGLVTDRDFCERVAARGVTPEHPLHEIMSAPLVAIPETALVYEAILAMQEKGKRHLAVKDAAGAVVGLVSDVELLQVQRYSSIVMTREVSGAETVEAMAAIYDRVPRLVAALLDSGARPRNITRAITAVQDAIVTRLIDLTLRRMGPPPAAFAFVALGSEGREEKTLVSDQDNAVVYADPDPGRAAACAAFFLELGQAVCDGLAQIGCPLCKGGIMAKTPRWCQPLGQWKAYFAQWIATASPQDFLEINMFFDLRPVYGAGELLAALRDHIHRQLRLATPFFVNYAQNELLYRPPLGLFGGIDSGKTLSLKDAIRPIVGFARLYSLRHGLVDTNTLDRLQHLVDRGVLARSIADESAQAYNFLLALRVQRQVQALDGGEPPTNELDPRSLSSTELTLLKQAFHQVTAMQRRVQHDFVPGGAAL
jgi:CBS domain-containing protein